MKKNYENVPVLLIGLGGIGSEIVDAVYGKLKNNVEAQNIEALVFDTDINSQKNLKNISAECKIQTSTDKSVKFALENDPTAKDWFPMHPLVEKMQMLNGAGQIRAVSRLALRHAMKTDKLTPINAVKERLFKLGSGINEKGLRVMIVTSMMGGTGSGIFLQIPLYIRELFESQFSGSADRIEIQGTFILPDVLKGAISKKEKENIYSNAYAAMKELNAIIMSLSGDGSNINLEYKPNQLNSEGMRDIALKSWPYDYCYFYDKEDTEGRILSNFNDYIKMIEDNLYLQMYGPLSDKMYSIYCNEIKDIISKGGKNIYGGLGVGKLIYPYDDIVDFCVDKTIQNSLNNRLLKIDHIYNNELDKYNKNIQKGIAAIMPNKEDVYITSFESLARTDNFYSNIKRTMTEYDDNNNEINNNIKKLLNKIEEEIMTVFSNNEEFKKLSTNCYIRPGTLNNIPKEKINSLVINYETNFHMYRIMIENKTQNQAETHANVCFGIYSDNHESILNEYIKNNDIYLNSVGIRYILYKTNKTLKQMKIELEKKLEENNNRLIKLEETSFISKNNNYVNAIKKSEEVLKNKGIFNKNINKFREDYERKSITHNKLLDEYCKDNLRKHFYNQSIKLLEGIINEYQNMFNRLEEQKYEIEKHINYLLTKHDVKKNTTNHYVLATKELKEQIWSLIPEEVKLGNLSGTLSKEMHQALYKGFREKIDKQNDNTMNYDMLFRNLIVKGCRENLLKNNSVREILQINIIEALEKEAELNGEITSKHTYINKKIMDLIGNISPWTPKSENTNDVNLWGISTNCRTLTESKTEKSMLEKYIEEASSSKLIANNIVANPIISNREIIYTTVRYGLMINDFTKFSAGKNNIADGEYYVAYKNLVDKIEKDGKTNIYGGTAITPHIDKRWHLTLRDINDSVYKKNLKDVAKAFIIGITNKNFDIKKSDLNEETTQFVSIYEGIPSTISYQGISIDGKLKNLYKALQGNPDLVRNILDDFEKYCESEKRNSQRDTNVLEIPFIENLTNVKLYGYNEGINIVDVFINLERETTKIEKEDKEYVEKYNLLYEVLFEVIEEAIIPYSFGKGNSEYKNNYKKIINSLIKNSYWENHLDKDSMVYAESLNRLNIKLKNI